MAWLDCHFRISEIYLIRITTREPDRWSIAVNLTKPIHMPAVVPCWWSVQHRPAHAESKRGHRLHGSKFETFQLFPRYRVL